MWIFFPVTFLDVAWNPFGVGAGVVLCDGGKHQIFI